MAGIDINRTTSGISLPKAVSSEVWGLTIKESAVMRAARRISIPGSGIQIDTLNGVGDAAWVSETAEKPVGAATFGNKVLEAYTLALIIPFSNQFRRDKAALYNEIKRVLPAELGRKFDSTVFGAITKPGSNFDNLAAATQVTVDGTDTYGDLVSLYTSLGGTRPSAWITSPAFEATLMGAKSGSGEYLFVPNGSDAPNLGRVLGAPVYATDGTFIQSTTLGDDVAVVGDFAGNAVWGSVEGIQYSESDQATLTLADSSTVNLWQRNMFAVRFEIELAFGVRDISKFKRVTDGKIDTP